MDCFAAGAATLTSCTFSNDISDNYYGGGVWDGAGTSTIMNCTFSGDSGYDGGGLYDNGAADLVNCTFNNDSASYEGGGLYDFDVATVAYCTFSQNTAQYGGGVYAYFGTTLNMQNTIAAGNSASKKGPDIYYFYAVRSFGGNVIGNTDGSNGWTSADLTGTAGTRSTPCWHHSAITAVRRRQWLCSPEAKPSALPYRTQRFRTTSAVSREAGCSRTQAPLNRAASRLPFPVATTRRPA